MSSHAFNSAVISNEADNTEVVPISTLCSGTVNEKFATAAAEAGEYPTIKKDGHLYAHPRTFYRWANELFGSSLEASGRIKKPVNIDNKPASK